MPILFSVALIPLLIALVVTALLTPVSIVLAKKLGIMDDPRRSNHPGIIHKKPVPRAGGIPIFLGASLAGYFLLPHTGPMYSLFIAGFIALFIGVVDDKLNARSQDVSPYFRFIINIVTAVIVVASGITIHFITNPFGAGIIHLDRIAIPLLIVPFHFMLSDILSVVWIIWVMNMLNWSKGVDGQMPGIVAISALVIGLLSIRFAPLGSTTYLDATLSFIIAGTAIGFLFYNFHPAKIFPGYGATALYLFLAAASILSSAKLATAILVMGVPIVDAIFTIVRCVISGHSPFLSDRRHLHHILLKLGYSQRQIALFYWVISAILGAISLTLESRSKLFAIIMLLAIVGGSLLFLHVVTRNANEEVSTR